jgi:hypothetical protein
MTEVRIGPMRWPDGTELTPDEEEAVKSRVGRAFDEIFLKWEPGRKILDPLIRAWWTEGEPCPDDLAEIIRETRELWKLAMVQADRGKFEARIATLERLTRAGFERRSADTR